MKELGNIWFIGYVITMVYIMYKVYTMKELSNYMFVKFNWLRTFFYVLLAWPFFWFALLTHPNRPKRK